MDSTKPKPHKKTHSLLKHSDVYLRVLGAVSVGGGLLLRFVGERDVPVEVWGVKVPLEYVFIVLGLLLLFLPLLFIYTLALFLPGEYKSDLLEYANSLDPEYRKLKEEPGPETFASVIYNHIQRTNRRFYLFVLVVICLCAALPFLVSDFFTKKQFTNDSKRLVNLVQETRIDSASADNIRGYLRELEWLKTSKASATRQSYELLQALFGRSEGNTPASFRGTVGDFYDKRIKPHGTEIGVLRIDEIKIDKNSWEDDLSPATYLTLLATVCNHVGDQGTHAAPYIQGVQLIKLADTYMNASTAVAPATHMARGLSYGGLVKTYLEFKTKFQAEHEAAIMREHLDINGMPSRLSLLREAISQFKLAEEQSYSKLSRARAINNRVDALLLYLYLIHIKRDWRDDTPRIATDDDFLRDELAWNGSPEQVYKKFDRLLKDIDEAITLSPQREFFGTRAQLLSIGGELGEKQLLEEKKKKPGEKTQTSGERNWWTQSQEILDKAMEDLRTSKTLQLDKKYLTKDFAEKHYLTWLFNKRSDQYKSLANP